MCLYTTKPAKIAEKPIIVYKLLLLHRILSSGDKIYHTPCQGTSVMINDTLKASVDTEPDEIGINNKSTFQIKGEGVHAYTSIKNAEKHSFAFMPSPSGKYQLVQNIGKEQTLILKAKSLPRR